ncbi:hypothetical protein DFQ28_009844 [Apophysomyces sp. BC1034]|nr:hypothetical protein DFQ28_009844 [Apophysomyces sp. BC1034]
MATKRSWSIWLPFYQNSIIQPFQVHKLTLPQSRHLYATSGASHSLEHILTLLTRPQTTTRFAIFQNPTYHLVFDIFKEAGFEPNQLVGISDTGEGLDVDELERFLASNLTPDNAASSTGYASVLYCVPTHSNPTSSILPAERRAKLVELARQYNVLVICDDVYDILTYRCSPPPQRVVAYDLETEGKPVVISNCSFSKLLSPGIRVGWVEAQEALIRRIGPCATHISGGQAANFVIQIVHQMLVTPYISLYDHVESLRDIMKTRLHKGLWVPIQNSLVPLGCSARLPSGGYFIWLRLPTGVTCDQLEKTIAMHDIPVKFGHEKLFLVPGSHTDLDTLNHIRLCFAHCPTHDLQQGIVHLTKAIRLTKELNESEDGTSWSIVLHKDVQDSL